MYEQLENLAEQLNNIAFKARMCNEMSHERFIEAMNLVAWMIDEADKMRAKEF